MELLSRATRSDILGLRLAKEESFAPGAGAAGGVALAVDAIVLPRVCFRDWWIGGGRRDARLFHNLRRWFRRSRIKNPELLCIYCTRTVIPLDLYVESDEAKAYAMQG